MKWGAQVMGYETQTTTVVVVYFRYPSGYMTTTITTTMITATAMTTATTTMVTATIMMTGEFGG